MPFRATRIPAMLARLQTALTMLSSLGGPDLLAASRLAAGDYNLGSSPLEIVGGGVNALREIESLVCNDDRMRIEAGQDLSLSLP